MFINAFVLVVFHWIFVGYLIIILCLHLITHKAGYLVHLYTYVCVDNKCDRTWRLSWDWYSKQKCATLDNDVWIK